ALNILRPLLAAEPQEAQLLRREAGFLKGQAEALRRLGDRQSALQSLQQARQIWRDLFARDATDQYVRAHLHPTLLALADTTLESGDHSGALAHYREALALAE